MIAHFFSLALKTWGLVNEYNLVQLVEIMVGVSGEKAVKLSEGCQSPFSFSPDKGRPTSVSWPCSQVFNQLLGREEGQSSEGL